MPALFVVVTAVDSINADHYYGAQFVVLLIHVLFMYWARLVSSEVDAFLSSCLIIGPNSSSGKYGKAIIFFRRAWVPRSFKKAA